VTSPVDDAEKMVLEKSLEEEYAKPYSGKSFWINDGGKFQEITIPKKEKEEDNNETN